MAGVVWLLSGACAAQVPGVRACGGEAYWPPMSYPGEGGQVVLGISPDVLRGALGGAKELRVHLLPWPRCVQEAARHNDADVAMALLRNPEREAQFLFSQPYHYLSPAYVYSTERFASAPVQRLQDLASLRVCALAGSAVAYTGLDPASVDFGARSHAALLGKLERGYCDVVVEMQEVLAGQVTLGLVPWDERRYRILRLPATERYPLHFGVGRQHPQAQALVERIDRGVQALARSGQLQEIVRRHQGAMARP